MLLFNWTILCWVSTLAEPWRGFESAFSESRTQLSLVIHFVGGTILFVSLVFSRTWAAIGTFIADFNFDNFVVRINDVLNSFAIRLGKTASHAIHGERLGKGDYWIGVLVRLTHGTLILKNGLWRNSLFFRGALWLTMTPFFVVVDSRLESRALVVPVLVVCFVNVFKLLLGINYHSWRIQLEVVLFLIGELRRDQPDLAVMTQWTITHFVLLLEQPADKFASQVARRLLWIDWDCVLL